MFHFVNVIVFFVPFFLHCSIIPVLISIFFFIYFCNFILVLSVNELADRTRPPDIQLHLPNIEKKNLNHLKQKNGNKDFIFSISYLRV